MQEEDLRNYYNLIIQSYKIKRVSVLVITSLKAGDLCTLSQKAQLKIDQVNPTYEDLSNLNKKYDYCICDLSYGGDMTGVVECLSLVVRKGGKVFINYLESPDSNIIFIKNEWAFSTENIDTVTSFHGLKIFESEKKGNRVYLVAGVGERSA